MTRGVRGWWRRRPLRTRLALLTASAVAVAVLSLAGLAWAFVGEALDHQVESQLSAEARAIAAQPQEWVPPAAFRGRGRGPGRRATDFGSRWQILAPDGTVRGASPEGLPVTASARQVASDGTGRAEQHVTIGSDVYLVLTVPASGGGAVQVAMDEGPVDRTRTTLGLLLLGASVVGIGGSALLGRAVARAGLVPVQRLTEAVESSTQTMDLARTMDLSQPVGLLGEDEVGRLGRAVNTLLAAVDSSRRDQRALVEDAGHELRTPLTSLRTNIELLLEMERKPELAHRLPPEERLQLLQDLDSQVLELTTLTGELVELAREEGAREAVERVDLADVVSAAVARVRARASGVTVRASLLPVVVLGRPAELERMVVNVLDNAVKWSPGGARVDVDLLLEGTSSCTLQVADTGPGIDEADRPYVFDRFYRAPAARGMPGSGLGLAIVAQTAAQHGGSAAVGPNHPSGTVLSVRLPVAAPSPSALEPSLDWPVYG
ncbi:two-component system sensor histidine kinase MprB [Motilibacter rhizosphaerae]|uniref:histidine kinase n=1 Tax=Motilibacter rhizosphaerae TaxID=598652 RepID=A0A4V2F563_9ACTN|nr:HAMP domain-containing sensor histidine kinase [Motilibacter rhizosphaerae]RZS91719.1 two-component system sensor histidine kinase MprB [Motilibacter rhizosphaerae]